MSRKRFSFLWAAMGSLLTLSAGPGFAQEPIPEGRIRRWHVDGSGDLSSDSQDLSLELQAGELFATPLFAIGRGRVGQDQFQNYDLHRWGADLGLGWEFEEGTNLEGGFRWNRYSVFEVSPDTDPAIRDLSGLSEVTALRFAFVRDRRDEPHYATQGSRFRLSGDLASKGLGGDHSFGRLEADAAFYRSPFQAGSTGGFLSKLTFAEHFRAGWVEGLDGAEGVPFFERYFAGGSSTVRGHRGRWLTPRGIGEQFVGGEILLLNNLELRMPLFEGRLKRKLSAACFFDVGRVFRRLSDIGDFGYGAGVGLRYIVHLGMIHGVARADVGFNLAPEGDDSTSNLHVTFGMPF